MTYSDELREFIKRWEGGPFLAPHWDAIGRVWDIAWGHVLTESEESRPITQDEAEMLLDWDLHFANDAVCSLVTFPVAQCQFDALVSWTYNLGVGNLKKSTLLKRVNAGDFDGAAEEFPKWANAGGRPIVGLARRRAAERAIFEAGNYDGRP